MKQSIKRLEATGIHGRYDIEIEFFQDVNIIHGANGTGKTTLLHILTNISNLELERFCYLQFHEIQLELSDKRIIKVMARPSENGAYISDVTLSIDNKHIMNWSPPSSDSDLEDSDLGSRWSLIERRRWEKLQEENKISVKATYFPAFRTMIEAWITSIDMSRIPRHRGVNRTLPEYYRQRFNPASSRRMNYTRDISDWARSVFGDFVPPINYPSPQEIEGQINSALGRSTFRLANEDRSLLSEVFTKVYDAISQKTLDDDDDVRTADQIRTNISEQLIKLQKIQNEFGLLDNNSAFAELKSKLESSELMNLGQQETTTIIGILKIYENALKQREKFLNEAFHTVRTYIDAVNNFLEGKSLVSTIQDQDRVSAAPQLQISHDDFGFSPIHTLSSGERQIAGLIYSASNVDIGNTILVDEPELSLHIDWQRKIIHAMMEQLASKQLIVCTHSPVIASDYIDKMIELKPKWTSLT